MQENTNVCAAPDCNNSLGGMLSSAKYCSNQCKWRAHKRKVYEQRRQRGQCTQCGGAMIEENERSYCESCKEYFKGRYYKQK